MKGILFTELLFNKTIRGEKTQTRREGSLKAINDNPDGWKFFDDYDTDLGSEYYKPIFRFDNKEKDIVCLNPRYQIGDICYLKEPIFITPEGECVYKYNNPIGTPISYADESKGCFRPIAWFNKLFMPGNLARYYIKIKDVKVERLFDISDEDCLNEGVDVQKTIWRDEDVLYVPHTVFTDYTNNDAYCYSPQSSFFSLFRFANKIPKSKEIPNIWCFVYDYVLCDKKGNKI